MSRLPSDATMLRRVNRELRECRSQLAELIRDRDQYKWRCAKFENELSQWKSRFDALLKISGEQKQ